MDDPMVDPMMKAIMANRAALHEKLQTFSDILMPILEKQSRKQQKLVTDALLAFHQGAVDLLYLEGFYIKSLVDMKAHSAMMARSDLNIINMLVEKLEEYGVPHEPLPPSMKRPTDH